MELRKWIREIVNSLPESICWHEGDISTAKQYPFVKYSEYSHVDYHDAEKKCDVCETGIELSFFMPYPRNCDSLVEAIDVAYDNLKKLRGIYKLIIKTLIDCYGYKTNGKPKKIERIKGRQGAIEFRALPYKLTECNLLRLRARVILRHPQGKSEINKSMLDKECLVSAINPDPSTQKGFLRSV